MYFSELMHKIKSSVYTREFPGAAHCKAIHETSNAMHMYMQLTGRNLDE